MTLFFLDHHNTTDALPYPRVLRLDGEAAPHGVQLQPAHAGDGSSLEQALNQALQQSETGPSRTAKDTPFQLFPLREGAELENPQNTSRNGISESVMPTRNLLGGTVPNDSQPLNAPAVSVLRILRGPDAGAAFPISRGRTSLGRAALAPRGGEQPHHIHLQDPFLKPVHGSFYADSSGIRWIEKRPSASEGSEKASGTKKMQSAEPRVLRWNEPFRLGSSLCMLISPTGHSNHTAENASAPAATSGESAQTLAPWEMRATPLSRWS